MNINNARRIPYIMDRLKEIEESGGGSGINPIFQFEFTLDSDYNDTTAATVVTIPCDELVEYAADLPVAYTPSGLSSTKLIYCEIRRAESNAEIATDLTFYMMNSVALLYRPYADRIAFGMWKPSTVQINGYDTRRYDSPYGLWWESTQYNTGIAVKARSGSSSNKVRAGDYVLSIYSLEGVTSL